MPLSPEIRGRGNAGPAVLFLHGLGSSSADWAFQLPAFETRHRLILTDLAGHGRAAGSPGRATVEAMAADVDGLLAALGEPAVHVVGLSLGGCVGLALALAAPARVRSLTLVNVFARLRPAGPRSALRMLTRLVLLGTAPMAVVAAHVARGLFPRPEQRDLYRMAVASLSRTRRGAYLAAVRALARFDARDRLGAIRCPTLVVAGAEDRTVPLAAKELLGRAIPGARLVVVEDSGHATPFDQPAAFNRAVLAFVEAH
ncbi:MAG: alpha/beta fold hydrolase [Candidatus Rokubacteria bacterium]|nr:alpha/beta fold hydrolase [Candidatus Rokubacteria bacterium]